MGFRKFKNENSADLVHKINLFDFETGDPAIANGRAQFLIVKGEKSRAYQGAVEREQALMKRKGRKADEFSFEDNAKVLARRMSGLIVAAYIDVGEDGEEEIIEFTDIDQLTSQERDQYRARLKDLFVDVTDLAVQVHEEVVKGVNFLPGRGQSLSSLSGSASGTTQSQTVAIELD